MQKLRDRLADGEEVRAVSTTTLEFRVQGRQDVFTVEITAVAFFRWDGPTSPHCDLTVAPKVGTKDFYASN
jgi:hypothetical protein